MSNPVLLPAGTSVRIFDPAEPKHSAYGTVSGHAILQDSTARLVYVIQLNNAHQGYIFSQGNHEEHLPLFVSQLVVCPELVQKLYP